MRPSRKLLGLGVATPALLLVAAACNAFSGVSDLEVCADDCGPPGASDANDASLEAPPTQADSSSETGPTMDAGADADAAKTPPLCDSTDTSLILCLPFDGNAVDGSGTPSAGIATGVTYNTGQVAQSAHFANGSVVFPYATKLDVNAVTIEAFIAPSSLPPPGTRMGIVDSDSRFGVFLGDGTLECRGGAGVNLVTAPTPAAGKFSHFACVTDGLVLMAYVDGVMVASMPMSMPIPKTSSGVVIGRNDPSGDPYAGMIDELRIYNRVRTAEEIAADAKRGK